MCGRYTLTTSAQIIAEFFKLSEVPDIKPRYNIAPTQSVATVTVAQKNAATVPIYALGFDSKLGKRHENRQPHD